MYVCVFLFMYPNNVKQNPHRLILKSYTTVENTPLIFDTAYKISEHVSVLVGSSKYKTLHGSTKDCVVGLSL